MHAIQAGIYTHHDCELFAIRRDTPIDIDFDIRMHAVSLQHQQGQVVLHRCLVVGGVHNLARHVQHLVVVIVNRIEVVPPQRHLPGRAGAVRCGDDDVGRDQRAPAEVLPVVLQGDRVGVARFGGRDAVDDQVSIGCVKGAFFAGVHRGEQAQCTKKQRRRERRPRSSTAHHRCVAEHQADYLSSGRCSPPSPR